MVHHLQKYVDKYEPKNLVFRLKVLVSVWVVTTLAMFGLLYAIRHPELFHLCFSGSEACEQHRTTAGVLVALLAFVYTVCSLWLIAIFTHYYFWSWGRRIIRRDEELE